MNTETASSNPYRLANILGQAGSSTLAVLSLLVAAILNPGLWLEFGIVLILVLLTSFLIIRGNRLVENSVGSSEIQHFSSAAENQKSKKEIYAGQVAKYWPAFALVMALSAAGLSLGAESNLSYGLSVFATALLLTNVHALSMTVPIAISMVLKVAAESGMIIRNRSAFEKAAKLTLVLFTKGGILTRSPSGVSAVRLASNSTIKDEHKLLALAASVESMSNHAFALSICNSALKANLKVTKPKNFMEIPGFGVQGVVGGNEVVIGSTALLIQRNIRMEVQEIIYADESANSGFSVVCVLVNGHLEGLFRLSDLVKPTSAQAVYIVARERIRVGIITGDSTGTAQKKASELAVSEVYAELSPERKTAFVSAERTKGSAVGIIANPTTDAVLLSTADVSIALAGESEELVESVDVVVKGDDPQLAAQVIALSARLRRKINLGLGVGLGYGVLSLVSYVAIVSPLQIPTSPALAALIGSLSVLFVTLNSYSLGKLK